MVPIIGTKNRTADARRRCVFWETQEHAESMQRLLPRLGGAFDLRLAVSVPLPIVMGIFVLLWFQSRLT